jgi:lysophospholipase L1-like esterase
LIKYDYEITVNGNQAKLNKDIYLFRENKNVHYYFAVKNASFNFKGSTDLIEKTNAINAAVTVIKPNNVEVASAIAKVENGKIHLKVTEDLIDEEVEVGDFDLVFDLFDDTDGAVTIPKVIGQFHVLERPCTTPISELVATNTTNEVDQALTDYAIVTYAEPVASTNADGTFAKKTWVAKEKITTAELNRMEEGISDVSSQCKDIANLSLTKHTDGKVYIKKQDGTLLGNGIEIGGSDVDLSKISMSMSGQTLKLLNDGTQIATVEIPTATVTDEQLTSIIQAKIDDGTLTSLTLGENSVDTINIKDNSITGSKINPKIGVNLFDATTVTENVILWGTKDNSYSETFTSNGDGITDYIPIEIGKTYKISHQDFNSKNDSFNKNLVGLYVAQGEKPKTILKGNNTTDSYEFTITDEEIQYIRVGFNLNYIDNFLISLKDDFEFLQKYTLGWLNITGDNIDKNFQSDIIDKTIIDVIKNTDVFPSQIKNPNLFDKTTITKGIVKFKDNDIISAECAHSDYIPVETGKTYKISSQLLKKFTNAQVLYVGYDNEKNAISQFTGSGLDEPKEFTITNQSIAFITVNLSLINLETLKLSKVEEFDVEDVRKFEWLEITKKNLSYVNRFYGKNLIVDGDSITNKNLRASKNWVDYVMEEIPFGSVKNYAVSGAGFVKNSKIIDRINNYNSDADVILIMGNMNDGTSGSFTVDGTTYTGLPLGNFTDEPSNNSVYGVMHLICQALITKYPTKAIGFISSTPRGLNGNIPNGCTGNANQYGIDGWYMDYLKAEKEVCQHYSIPFLDLYTQSGLRPWDDTHNSLCFKPDGKDGDSYEADKVHPNSIGHKIIAYKIIKFIEQYM